MIYTVTFNPSLDYIVDVPEFTTGAINRTARERLFPGGKGINVSIVLKNLGFDSTALGFTAGLTGETFKNLLEEKNISHEFITVKEGMTRINVKLRSGVETEINGRGPMVLDTEVSLLYEKLDRLQKDDILVLAGSIPETMKESSYMDICNRLRGRGIHIVVDATNDLLRNVLQYHPFLIKPNHHELGELFQTKICNKEEVIFYAEKLRNMGAKNVLVSMAGEGAVLVTENDEILISEAPKGILVNSVGAGDSMVAGFLAGFLAGHDYKKAFQTGVLAGSASAFSEELATMAEVSALLNSNKGIFKG